jgi:hypothetical protein
MSIPTQCGDVQAVTVTVPPAATFRARVVAFNTARVPVVGTRSRLGQSPAGGADGTLAAASGGKAATAAAAIAVAVAVVCVLLVTIVWLVNRLGSEQRLKSQAVSAAEFSRMLVSLKHEGLVASLGGRDQNKRGKSSATVASRNGGSTDDYVVTDSGVGVGVGARVGGSIGRSASAAADPPTSSSAIPREIKRQCVTMVGVLGSGNFGDVHKAILDEAKGKTRAIGGFVAGDQHPNIMAPNIPTSLCLTTPHLSTTPAKNIVRVRR